MGTEMREGAFAEALQHAVRAARVIGLLILLVMIAAVPAALSILVLRHIALN